MYVWPLNKLHSPTNQIPNDLRDKTNFSNRWFSSDILEARSLNMMRIALISKIRPQNDYLLSVQHNLKIVLIVFVNEYSFNTPLISTIEHKNIISMHHIHNTMHHWACFRQVFRVPHHLSQFLLQFDNMCNCNWWIIMCR